MLKLYHGITSVCSIKVRLGLAEIGLAYDEAVLDLKAGDQHAPAYLALNPDGVVPTLVDGSLIVTESSLILEYLDRSYNQSGLMPDGRDAEVRARHWLVRCLAIHDAINSLTFSTAMRDDIVATRSAEEIERSISRMPNPAMQLKRRDLLANGLSSPWVDQALLTLARTFADMQSALAHGAWVTGMAFGIADIALLPYIDRLDRLGLAGLWQEQDGDITPWLATMQSRESYRAEVSGRIPEMAAAKMREAGTRHWPELRKKALARES